MKSVQALAIGVTGCGYIHTAWESIRQACPNLTDLAIIIKPVKDGSLEDLVEWKAEDLRNRTLFLMRNMPIRQRTRGEIFEEVARTNGPSMGYHRCSQLLERQEREAPPICKTPTCRCNAECGFATECFGDGSWQSYF